MDHPGQRFVLGLFAVGIVLVLASDKLSGQTYLDIHDFNCSTEGCYPGYPAHIAQGRDGNLYGTTDYNNGSIFKITPSGRIATIYTFNFTNGADPQAGLTLGPDGDLYGTTSFGKDTNGSIFKITPAGKLTTLHTFTDGSGPIAPLVLADDGDFYGVAGGNPGVNGYRISSTGEYKVLTSSIPGSGGAPWAPLIQASDGNFYSTTYDGGTNDAGTVYRMSPAGAVKIIYNFDVTHGGWGYAPLVQDAKGYLYGTEAQGGSLGGGVVFRVTTGGELTVLHNFVYQDSVDGWGPSAGLVLGPDGNLYGSASVGGPQDDGVLFKITRSGKYTRLYDFDGTHGGRPGAAATQHTNGKIYSTTPSGGAYGGGVVYSLGVGQQPFVSLLFNVGKIGRVIGILGHGFNGTTDVSFNGTTAGFKVVSNTYLVAKVPPGATTGFATVTTRAERLKSNRQFRVRSSSTLPLN